MSLLSGFEQRLERAVEGFFSKVFRSGVHPIEIGKRIQRVMEEGQASALRRTYAPSSYRIKLSTRDYERLAPLEPKIVEELEIFVAEAARQRDWALAETPRVSFSADQSLSGGEFRVEADPVSLEHAASRRSTSKKRRIAPGKPVLVVLDERSNPLRTLPLDGPLRIGRHSDNELVLPDSTISRQHAEIADRSGNGSFVLRDLDSRNGTIVNGVRITEHRLRDGDRIVIGQTVMEFRRG